MILNGVVYTLQLLEPVTALLLLILTSLMKILHFMMLLEHSNFFNSVTLTVTLFFVFPYRVGLEINVFVTVLRCYGMVYRKYFFLFLKTSL